MSGKVFKSLRGRYARVREAQTNFAAQKLVFGMSCVGKGAAAAAFDPRTSSNRLRENEEMQLTNNDEMQSEKRPASCVKSNLPCGKVAPGTG